MFLFSAVVTLAPSSDFVKSWIGGPLEVLALLAAAALAYQVAYALREVPEMGRNWLRFATGRMRSDALVID